MSLAWLFHTSTNPVFGGDSPVPNAAGGPVALTQDDRSFTLANGLVTARIEKRSGNLVSLTYEGLELLAQGERGASGGYWSSVGRARPGPQHAAVVRTNPATLLRK